MAVISGAAILATSTSAVAADYPGKIGATTSAAGGMLTYNSPNTGEKAGTMSTAELVGPNAPTAVSLPIGDDGRVSFTLQLPTDAPTGAVYTLDIAAGTFEDSQTITIAGGQPADAAVAVSATTGFSDGIDLVPLIWFGAGVLAFIAAGIFVASSTRRMRKL